MERVLLLSKEKPSYHHMLFFMCLVCHGFPNENDVFHMVVDLCQVLNPCSAWFRDSEVALLTNQEGVRWASCCWKPIVSLRVYNSMGSSPNSASKNMIGSCRSHFDVRHHMHLHALLGDFPIRAFQVTSPNFGSIHESGKHKSLE